MTDKREEIMPLMDPEQMKQIAEIINEGIEDGAAGRSTGKWVRGTLKPSKLDVLRSLGRHFRFFKEPNRQGKKEGEK